mgnify:CR=1 FL=1
MTITTKEGHEHALFLSIQKRRICVQSIENLVSDCAKHVTTLKHITPHKLRSTYGTNLYRETGDIYLVAEVLGHNDVNTTRKHPDAADPLMRWAEFVEKTEWKSHAELKQAFPSADYIGNDRYVFNISGNKFRLVTIVVFFQGFLHIRFVGTHAEYDKIKDIKNI